MHATNRSDKTHFVCVYVQDQQKKNVWEKAERHRGLWKAFWKQNVKEVGVMKKVGNAEEKLGGMNKLGKMKEKHGSKDSDGSLCKAEKLKKKNTLKEGMCQRCLVETCKYLV